MASTELTDAQRRTLGALCDTLIAVAPDEGASDEERAFFARPAGDLGIPLLLEQLPPGGLLRLLDELGESFASVDGVERTRAIHAHAHAGGAEGGAVRAVKEAVAAMFYALPDASGRRISMRCGPGSA